MGLKIYKEKELSDYIINRLGETLDGYEDYFKYEVKNGISEIWNINNDESFAITRLETDDFKNRTILVVCCYKGKNLREFVDHITAICDRQKWFLRFHTKRPALAKWMQKRDNFNIDEFVLIRRPSDGQQK